MKTEIHIGKSINEKLKEEGRSKTWLAKQVNCDHSSLCKSLKKTHIDTELLFHISLALNYDFFALYSTSLCENKLEDLWHDLP
jgi:hypothetical protein